jgi:hypothetical protein
MRKILAILLMLAAVSTSGEFNRHSVSLSIVPIKPLYFYPDLGYEYSITDKDALGFYTVVGIVNRIAYSRRIGDFRLAGSLGFAFEDQDFSNTTVIYAFTLEHRVEWSEHIYTRTLIGAGFAEGLFGDMPFVPVLQVGLGYSF